MEHGFSHPTQVRVGSWSHLINVSGTLGNIYSLSCTKVSHSSYFKIIASTHTNAIILPHLLTLPRFEWWINWELTGWTERRRPRLRDTWRSSHATPATCCWTWTNSDGAASWPTPPWSWVACSCARTVPCSWPAGWCKSPNHTASYCSPSTSKFSLSLPLQTQRVLLLALLPPHVASGAWARQRGASQHRVPPWHLGPVQHLAAAGFHVHLPAPSDSERGLRGARCCHVLADGPRGWCLPRVHAAALVRQHLQVSPGEALLVLNLAAINEACGCFSAGRRQA